VGTDSPPFGFERTEAGMAEVVDKVTAAAPDLVFVGLGFPKQERVISRLREVMPATWYLGCGAGIPMAAGEFSRAPAAMQKAGAEWLHRLALEPKRLARRYLLEDAPFAVRLLGQAAIFRLSQGRGRPKPPAPLRVARNHRNELET
jgi:N-acetylglucosaminyldiphosphoundecaprenol N-acetyl-beta-D-mannosaminyltransferase